MKINVLTDRQSWLAEKIPAFVKDARKFGEVNFVHSQDDLKEADVSFFLSCFELVKEKNLRKSKHNLVVHESALPEGRGWSPLTWQVLEGKKSIPVVLFEASAKVDDGKIYLEDSIALKGDELLDELRDKQAETTFRLCLKFLSDYKNIADQGREQSGKGSSYKRRGPEDSRLDPEKTIAEQFNLLRVVDNERYPAFFELNGVRYNLKIEKAGK